MTLKIAGGLAGCGLLLAGIFFSLAGKENEQPPKEASLIQSISGTGIIRGVLRGLSRQRRQRRRSYGEVAQGCAARSDACCGAEWREVSAASNSKNHLRRGARDGWAWDASHAGVGTDLLAISRGTRIWEKSACTTSPSESRRCR